MSRLIIVLVLGVVVFGAILWFVAFRDKGLPKADVEKAQAEVRKYDEATATLTRYGSEVAGALKEYPALLRAYPGSKAWPDQCQGYLADLKDAAPTREAVTKLLERNRSKDQGRLDELRMELSQARTEAMHHATRLARKAEQTVGFLKNVKKSTASMKADYQQVLARDLTALAATVAQAGKDWPAKRTDLQRRLEGLQEARKRALDQWQAVAATAEKVTSAGTVDESEAGKLVQASWAIREARQWLDKRAPSLPALAEQLYWSVDRILVDIDIREGGDVTFHHKIKTVRTRAVAKGEQATRKVTESWKQVSRSEYERRKNQLGMAIEQKPAGKYDREVERMAQPPGYRYVADPSVGRNHYGYWGHSHGYHYWHWYPRYGYMHGMYWGPRYGRITSRDYAGFTSAKQSGKSYQGRDSSGKAAFGSAGSATKSQYSGSKYMRTGGHRSSQFVRSGGTYRGSRYTSRTRSYRSGSRSGSRSRGGK